MTDNSEEDFVFDGNPTVLKTENQYGDGAVYIETLYQAFKSRMMRELDLSEPMTAEEYGAWVAKMVMKKEK